MRVLIIAHDPALSSLLRRRLWREGHVVAVASPDARGLHRAESGSYDALILAVTVHDADSVAMIQRLRGAGMTTPILMLAAHATVQERVQGLDAGADDYLTTPLAFAELTARLRALARRGLTLAQDDHLAVGDLRLDRRTRIVTRGRRQLTLAPKEFAVLDYLMSHPGQVVTRTVLLEQVWDYGFDPRANVVDAAIKRLRKAVDAGEAQPLIQTVRGVGYTIRHST